MYVAVCGILKKFFLKNKPPYGIYTYTRLLSQNNYQTTLIHTSVGWLLYYTYQCVCMQSTL